MAGVGAKAVELLNALGLFKATNVEDALNELVAGRASQAMVPTDLPTGAIAQSCVRNSQMGNLGLLTSGRETMCMVPLLAGQVITGVAWKSGTQAAVTPANQWTTIRNAARQLQTVSADLLTTAWAATSFQTFTFTTSWTVPQTGNYYIGLMENAATPPSLYGPANDSTVMGVPPIVTGTDNTNTGLTTPSTAPATSAALTATGSKPYCYILGTN